MWRVCNKRPFLRRTIGSARVTAAGVDRGGAGRDGTGRGRGGEGSGGGVGGRTGVAVRYNGRLRPLAAVRTVVSTTAGLVPVVTPAIADHLGWCLMVVMDLGGRRRPEGYTYGDLLLDGWSMLLDCYEIESKSERKLKYCTSRSLHL